MSKQLRLTVLVALVIGCGLLMTSLTGPASGQGAASSKSSHYTVVSTEGTNLIVTDDGTNTLYFYTIDEDAEPGDDLKLRASVDLNKVGQAVIKPKLNR